ncbi:pullulanase-type alpha-1,6-glucosidase [Photobacterium frigidiphilum]|uniref:pullulanase-type alpha-1,6-glucosidase n=1 Tax=Photobacterium frigidiphilum TaxID=264736 RepID=UPI003D0D6B32
MNFKLSTIAKLTLPLLSAVTLVGCNSSSSDNAIGESGKFTPINKDQAAIYFKLDPAQAKAAGSYDGYTLHIWNDDTCGSYANADSEWETGVPFSGVDETYGAYWVIDLKEDATQCVNFIPRDANRNKPLGEFNGKLDLEQVHKEGNYVFTQEGISAVFPEYIPPLPEKTARVFLNMDDDMAASNVKLHVWNDDTCAAYAGSGTSWDAGLPITGNSETYGDYWDIALKDDASNCVNFIPHDGDEKPLLENTQLDLEQAAKIGNVAFTFEGSSTVYYQPMAKLPSAMLSGASAHWLTADILALESGAARVELLYASKAGIEYNSQTQTFSGVEKTVTSSKTTNASWSKAFPHLQVLESWQLDFESAKADPKALLKGQLIAVSYDAAGKVLVATQVQPSGALDMIYTGNAGTGDDLNYGAIIAGGDVQFTLWAPTAQSVSVVKYSKDKYPADKKSTAELPMTFDADSGAWILTTNELQAEDYYRYRVKVYHPLTKVMMDYEVTDPYSLSLSMNSEFSQVIDLNSEDLKPADWDKLQRPMKQDNPSKFVIYEAHVRDFSAQDESTPADKRGKFNAFTKDDTDDIDDTVPVSHLKSLQEKGVTHLQLLPIFDIATINEDPNQVANIDELFSKLCAVNSDVKTSSFKSDCSSDLTIAEVLKREQGNDITANPSVQELNRLVSATDSFNWGYDPLHYTVPEGSYSTKPDGKQRILEMREMVKSIKTDIGMNVVMDVVYNHTNSAGPESDTSVLDKIVPWYYNRLNPVTGSVENSTCCSNTAPERAMMGKLIKDSLVVWSRDYKIDSFRFDLMGHHPLAQIQESLAAVQKVDPNTYFYGEGWNFGEVENDSLFVQATQPNLGGTGIGSFSDRLRDAVRGGGPFDGGTDLRKNQGFGNGAFVQPNDISDTSKETALHLADLTRLGMAGNLKDFMLIDSKGKAVSGAKVDYNGQPAGYAKDPSEVQNYVSKHDNQTLWDNNQYKIPYDVTSATRVRMQTVSLSTAMLGQGVPFLHMGSELLRSKSMQRDSYDSGDWYNKVDFTLEDNNWNKGLPRADKDSSNYDIITKVIEGSGENAKPTSQDMKDMVSFYKELANLRQSYPLITLGTGKEVNARVDFHNTGAAQEPGLIVMSIDNGTTSGTDVDPTLDAMVIVINATPTEQTFDIKQAGFTVSEKHTTALATDASVADTKLTIPAWTPVVFVQKRSGERGTGLPVSSK